MQNLKLSLGLTLGLLACSWLVTPLIGQNLEPPKVTAGQPQVGRYQVTCGDIEYSAKADGHKTTFTTKAVIKIDTATGECWSLSASVESSSIKYLWQPLSKPHRDQ